VNGFALGFLVGWACATLMATFVVAFRDREKP
jgi:hypothetical protein